MQKVYEVVFTGAGAISYIFSAHAGRFSLLQDHVADASEFRKNLWKIILKRVHL